MNTRSVPALAVALAVALVVAGCGSSGSRDEHPAAVTTTAAGGAPLYDLPEMRRARVHRDEGARALESASASRRSIDRETNFTKAYEQFEDAQAAYHEALPIAPERYRPVIENEIEQVAQYMMQIQRDRAPPK